MTKQIKPPFNAKTAKQKVQLAEDLWNTRDPKKISLAYAEDSQWRNRNEFVEGREAIAQLLTRKWKRELDYKLKKDLFIFSDNRIAVHFEYEYHDDSGQWFHAFGNEHWEFDEDGLMRTRDASINELAINSNERSIH